MNWERFLKCLLLGTQALIYNFKQMSLKENNRSAIRGKSAMKTEFVRVAVGAESQA